VTDKAGLLALVGSYLRREIPTAEFCDAYERGYNFEMDRKALSSSEAAIFESLLSQVIFYSPYGEEESQFPNLRNEQEIRRAAEAVASQLVA
jgi:hypothetical protein